MPRLYSLSRYRDLRKRLRNNLTTPEVILWYHLKHRKFHGYKFRRQHSVGWYILDFYCPRLRLAIEVDGGQHYTPEGLAYDEIRTKYLGRVGIDVVRFTNTEILRNINGVLMRLGEVVRRRSIATSPFRHLPKDPS